MTKGTIGVTSENIFPVIKKFMYSDHEIFLRELVSNAVDATQKLKTLASVGEFKGELGDLKIRISVDKKKKTITISDRGIGMTAEEIDQFINQIAFSSAEQFLEKYKNDAQSIIGHFGLGFYSAFMVSKKVEIFTLSYKEGAVAQHWSCNGDPEYVLEDTIKSDRGTDVVLHLDDDNLEFLEEAKIRELLLKYCRFLPVEIAFGKKKEWKDGKYVETDEDEIINNTQPAWIRKPSELTEEDYLNFYRELFPYNEDPLFYIHLNVDYPFHLTGILYFPKIKNNIDIQRNKIQLYCNQVFVTDHVENIVPEYLTLLHGVIDSPDIPLNVSRSFLQNDSNVRKISNHITKKVADRLQEIFKNDRNQFEQKWDDLKLFIQYGMLTDEKFYERAEKFALFKNVDGKYFTYEEYKTLIGENQKDKNGDLIYLYATNAEEQYSYIQHAKDKGYDVLLMDGQLDIHLIGHLEQKWEKTRFVRVDSDVIEKLIQKEDTANVSLSEAQREALTAIFNSQLPPMEKTNFIITFEQLGPNVNPVLITQNEFMRRMKEMSAMQGGMMNFYGEMPDSYNLVVNTTHPLIEKLLKDEETACAEELAPIEAELLELSNKLQQLKENHKNKKEEEIPAEEKEELTTLEKRIDELKEKRKSVLAAFASNYKTVRQLIDLALLGNNMLKGEALANFVKRSIDLM
ncbi:MAG: molecular chaperone HtpG [Paludibacteraceae bacterium]|nr:molecular chaperone HtpG [Paludibacteraceae bacterium]OPZ02738.1 MAG: Chaperone protein HtpG [Bacteroidetes bacterium ADurb.BinA395]MBP8966413.1 molecular chaperone HtpG [Paludibacteraceae bacterium]HOF98489.1 molecular chaperone HtpG [Paludibacteraceae bacterium]HOR39090.1 molecular chaperone HtpG [Paludibacteraceae bacterium]